MGQAEDQSGVRLRLFIETILEDAEYDDKI